MTPKLLPFAKPLKDEAKAAGYDKETDPAGYRKYCQEKGAGERAKDPKHWVRKWREQVDKLEESDEYPLVLIVDDCRYPNEQQASEKDDAIYIFVNEGDRILEDPKGEWRNHESEVMADEAKAWKIDLWPHHIYNSGTKEEFLAEIAQVAPTWLECWDCDCAVCVALRVNEPCEAQAVIETLRQILEDSDENSEDADTGTD